MGEPTANAKGSYWEPLGECAELGDSPVLSCHPTFKLEFVMDKEGRGELWIEEQTGNLQEETRILRESTGNWTNIRTREYT